MIAHAVQRHAEAAHAVPQQEHAFAGIFRDGEIDDHVGVVGQIGPAFIEGTFSLAAAVAAVIKAVAADARLVKRVHQIIIPSLMLAQAVDDHRHRLGLSRKVPFHVQLGSVKGLDHLFVRHAGASL